MPSWEGDLVAWIEVETPEFGASWFAVAVEEHGTLAGENGDGRLFEEDAAVMVAAQADA